MLEPFSPSFDARTIVPLPTEVAGQLVHNAVLLSGLNECISNNDFGFRTDRATMEVRPNPGNTWKCIIHKHSWRCFCVMYFHSSFMKTDNSYSSKRGPKDQTTWQQRTAKNGFHLIARICIFYNCVCFWRALCVQLDGCRRKGRQTKRRRLTFTFTLTARTCILVSLFVF